MAPLGTQSLVSWHAHILDMLVADPGAPLQAECRPLASFKDADALLHALTRDLNALSDDSKEVRRASVARISTCLFGFDATDADASAAPRSHADGDEPGHAAEDRAPPSPVSVVARSVAQLALIRAVAGTLAKPLLRRFSDPAEAVRLGAVRTMSAVIESVRDLSQLLPYLMPALTDRAASTWVFDLEQKMFAKDADAHDAYKRGRVVEAQQGVLARASSDVYTSAVAEPSEATREALVQCLRAIFATAAREGTVALLGPYMGDLVMVAHALAVDASPDVKVAGMSLFESLVGLIPETLRYFAVGLVRSFMVAGLDHRLARVRLATLGAVDALVLCPDEMHGRGCGSEAILSLLGGRDANVVPISAFYGRDSVVNYFAKLIMDSNLMVRQRFVLMLSNWMTKLLDRHEWWPRLMPYVMTAFCDESPVVAGLARACIGECGRQHEADHASSILERVQRGVDGEVDVPYGRPLVPPLTERPRIGTRWFVRAHARRFVTPIVTELYTFSTFGGPAGVDTRARAAQLLCVAMCYMEEQITQDVSDMIPMLVKLADDPSLQPWITCAARLMGRFVHPKAYLPVLLRHVLADPAVLGLEAVARDSAAYTSAALHVLAAALSESPSVRLVGHGSEVLSALVSPAVLDVVTGAVASAVPHTRVCDWRAWVSESAHAPCAPAPTLQSASAPAVRWLQSTAFLIQHLPHAFRVLGGPAAGDTASNHALEAAQALLQATLAVRGAVATSVSFAGSTSASWKAALSKAVMSELQLHACAALPVARPESMVEAGELGALADAVLALLTAAANNTPFPDALTPAHEVAVGPMALAPAVCTLISKHAVPLMTAFVGDFTLTVTWSAFAASCGGIRQILLPRVLQECTAEDRCSVCDFAIDIGTSLCTSSDAMCFAGKPTPASDLTSVLRTALGAEAASWFAPALVPVVAARSDARAHFPSRPEAGDKIIVSPWEAAMVWWLHVTSCMISEAETVPLAQMLALVDALLDSALKVGSASWLASGLLQDASAHLLACVTDALDHHYLGNAESDLRGSGDFKTRASGLLQVAGSALSVGIDVRASTVSRHALQSGTASARVAAACVRLAAVLNVEQTWGDMQAVVSEVTVLSCVYLLAATDAARRIKHATADSTRAALREGCGVLIEALDELLGTASVDMLDAGCAPATAGLLALLSGASGSLAGEGTGVSGLDADAPTADASAAVLPWGAADVLLGWAERMVSAQQLPDAMRACSVVRKAMDEEQAEDGVAQASAAHTPPVARVLWRDLALECVQLLQDHVDMLATLTGACHE